MTLPSVIQIAADVFAVPASSLSAESSPESVAAWDSVQHLNLVMALEEKFGLQFDPEDYDGMKSLGHIAGLVDARRG